MAEDLIIDISPLIKGDKGSKAKDVDEKIRQACQEIGVFLISGHGIETRFMEDVLLMTRKLFDLPHDKKMKLNLSNSSVYRGYIEQGTEYTADKIDVKEGFYLGLDAKSDHPDVVAGIPLVGANQYPDDDDIPGFSEIINTHMDHMAKIGEILMRSIGRGLRLSENLFASEVFNPPSYQLGLWHYPPFPGCTDEGPWGVGPHTDYGVLTFLLQDEVGGLQFHMKSGEWIDINPIPGTFVVNIGDTIEAWTQGAYRATLHRVKNSSNRHRYSAPFFYQPNSNCVIKPLDIPEDILQGVTGGPPKLMKDLPFKFGEYVQAKFIKSYGKKEPIILKNK